MNCKYTSLPLRAAIGGCGAVKDSNNRVVATVWTPTVDETINEGESWLDMRERTEAARIEAEAEEQALMLLFSAAPDLLKELVSALDSLEYVNRIAPGLAGYGVRAERIANIRIALEKAGAA